MASKNQERVFGRPVLPERRDLQVSEHAHEIGKSGFVGHGDKEYGHPSQGIPAMNTPPIIQARPIAKDFGMAVQSPPHPLKPEMSGTFRVGGG